MGALRVKMERDLVVRGLSERTGQGYLRSVAGLCIVAIGVPVYYLWRRRSPAPMGS